MALEFHHGTPARAARVGVLAGTFNPPTVAHMALARSALKEVEQVLFVLPRRFPHKPYENASFGERVEMLAAAAGDEPRFAVASSAGGLFIEIARECRAVFTARPAFLCGRDAAERVVNWDYGAPGAFARMLEEFDLLVAARGGAYRVPPEYAHAVRCLSLPAGYEEISATEVRNRIRRREPWEHLVPPEVAPLARRVYLPAT